MLLTWTDISVLLILACFPGVRAGFLLNMSSLVWSAQNAERFDQD
jgi:hypothetical protein